MVHRQGPRAQSCVLVTLASVIAAACGEDAPPVGLLSRFADGSSMTSIHPPIRTGCGKLQPGYDPGPPDADPPAPTLNGEPYIPEEDPFCTVAWTEQFSTDEDKGVHLDEWMYIAAIGEPNPGVAIPAWHSEDDPPCDVTGTLEDAPYFYCHFRWSVEVEPYEDHDIADVQVMHMTLEDVSLYCSEECRGPAGYQAGVDTETYYMAASTDPAILIDLVAEYERDKVRTDPEGEGDVRFQGYFGLPETGGATRAASPFDEPGGGGHAFFYRTCEPDAIAGQEGPGFCHTCRLISDGLNSAGTEVEFPACTWDDVRTLPADETMVHPEWREDYSALYQEVYGHR